MSEARQPALFFGHGTPMNALGGRYAQEWRMIGRSLARPNAVLVVSAHWFIDGVAATAMERPPTIHDFYGFPKELYELVYPAAGAPWLARRIADLTGAAPDAEWGLDHGAWSVLMHVFPQADVPVVQLSLDRRRAAPLHYELGRKLAPLRDEGVLIIGSGDVVHNLGMMRREGGPAYDWAQRFHDLVKAAVASRDHAALMNPHGEDAARAIPTPEHYLPLLYVLATQAEDERASFFTDAIDMRSVSMLGVRVDVGG